MRDELAQAVREAWAPVGEVEPTPGPRGALGRIWRLDRYALKQIFAEPPSDQQLAAELDFGRRAAAAGVRLPACHPDRTGRYLVTGPDGTWLRLYDWVDLTPLDLSDPAVARDLGVLLARLHRCAPPGCPPVEDWYERTPDDAARCTPSDPARLIICHRDLHPDNVQAGPDGSFVVVDWGDLGPADPARELARTLVDWFGEGDLGLARVAYDAYRAAGGPARITGPADFTMLIATWHNFVAVQRRALADPRHRRWAEQEIADAMLRRPTPRLLAAALQVLLSSSSAEPGSGPSR